MAWILAPRWDRVSATGPDLARKWTELPGVDRVYGGWNLPGRSERPPVIKSWSDTRGWCPLASRLFAKRRGRSRATPESGLEVTLLIVASRSTGRRANLRFLSLPVSRGPRCLHNTIRTTADSSRRTRISHSRVAHVRLLYIHMSYEIRRSGRTTKVCPPPRGTSQGLVFSRAATRFSLLVRSPSVSVSSTNVVYYLIYSAFIYVRLYNVKYNSI